MFKFTGKTRWIVLALLLALAVSAMLAWSLRTPRVEVLTLQPGALVRTLQFSARVATLSRVEVGSTLTGRVDQVRVREGAQVRAGEVLLSLETEELDAAVAQAVAALRQADATLVAAQATQARGEQLVLQGFYSAAQQDELRRAVDVALAQQGSARAALAAARARRVQAVVRSPSDARVLARQVEPGQIVQPGKALLSLALSGPTQLTAQVDERFLDQLQTGQSAQVVADAFARQRFAARVLSIAPLVDAQRGAIEVKFTLDGDPPAYLREDMTLSVEVETARREQALVLPLSVLRDVQGDVANVLVSVDGRATVRPVRLGLRTLEAVEVLQGLRAGDSVVLASTVRAGQRLQPQPVVWQPGAPGTGGSRESGGAGAALSQAMGR